MQRERESERAREREGAWRRERALHSRGKPQSKCDPAEIWFRSPVTTIKHKHLPGRYSSPPVVLRTFRSSCNSQTPQKNPTGPSPGRPMHRDALPLPTTHTHTLNPNPFPGGAMHEDALPRLEMSCTRCTAVAGCTNTPCRCSKSHRHGDSNMGLLNKRVLTCVLPASDTDNGGVAYLAH